MSYINWVPEYNVSVKRFNDDHKELFGYLNDLHRGVKAGLTITDMGYIIKGLVTYTDLHFKNEEKLMVKYGYPEYESHKKEHDDLLKEVGTLYEEFMQGKRLFSMEILSFLNNWVSNHILVCDMKYKPFFRKIALKQKERVNSINSVIYG